MDLSLVGRAGGQTHNKHPIHTSHSHVMDTQNNTYTLLQDPSLLAHPIVPGDLSQTSKHGTLPFPTAALTITSAFSTSIQAMRSRFPLLLYPTPATSPSRPTPSLTLSPLPVYGTWTSSPRGPNVYKNVTAAQRREKQGAYEIWRISTPLLSIFIGSGGPKSSSG